MILVFIENENNSIKKASEEALAYGAALASQLGVGVKAVGFNISSDALAAAGNYGVNEALSVNDEALASGMPQAVSSALFQIAEANGANTVVLAHSSLGESASSRLAVKLQASVVTNVVGLPDTSAGFKVRKGVYTGKAFTEVNMTTDKKVMTVKKNGFDFTAGQGSATVSEASVSIAPEDSKVKVLETKKQEGTILLPEADLVVSAGRGLKGPENWGMIEELAGVLGAATACSKPVSDVDWRPHHEHVGQTGIKVSPNLYIAIGISGAIQHLAGVSSSKVIVVINTDEEAPFFKAADYGIVGDAFDVVPKLIEALKNS